MSPQPPFHNGSVDLPESGFDGFSKFGLRSDVGIGWLVTTTWSLTWPKILA
jgi:hypothetical protein